MPFSVPNTFVPFTTIYSSLMNANFTSLVNDGNTHEAAITGIHGVGSGDIVGTTLSQTLTNKTLTTPTINGGTISGTMTFDGSVSFTGTTSFTTPIVYAGGITVPTTQHVNFNVGATSYISEVSAGNVRIVAGGSTAFGVTSSGIGIEATSRINFDGVGVTGDTYITEISSNNIQVVAGGSNSARFDSSGLLIDTGDRLWLDYAKTTSILQNSGTIQLSPASGIVLCNAYLQLNDATFSPAIDMICSRSAAKAWGTVSAGGSLGVLGFNVTSSSRSGTGDYRINFTTAFSNTNYVIFATPVSGAGANACYATSVSTTQATINVVDFTDTLKDGGFYFVVFGN